MKPINYKAAALLGALTILVAASIQAQNLLTNGSFEFPAGSSAALGAGNTNIPGWSITGTRAIWRVKGPVPGSGFEASDGQQYVDFNGRYGTVTLSQSFPTAEGETYEARFTVGRLQGELTMHLDAAVLSQGGTVLTNIETLVPQVAGWNPPTVFRFVATTPISTIAFTDTTGSDNYDLTLDAVSVERVTPRLSIECSHVRICWDSLTNHSYQLQYRSELTTNVWMDLGAPIAGTGATECTVQPVSGPGAFYRIIRLP